MKSSVSKLKQTTKNLVIEALGEKELGREKEGKCHLCPNLQCGLRRGRGQGKDPRVVGSQRGHKVISETDGGVAPGNVQISQGQLSPNLGY